MKKVFILLLIFSSFFACSCEKLLKDFLTSEIIGITVFNDTNEDVELYHNAFIVGPYYSYKIPRSETLGINVEENTKYYAEGVTTKKIYGSKSFTKNDTPWWHIKDTPDNQ
jgi:hypothetical protein